MAAQFSDEEKRAALAAVGVVNDELEFDGLALRRVVDKIRVAVIRNNREILYFYPERNSNGDLHIPAQGKIKLKVG